MEFSRQESWSEFSFPSPGDLRNPGIYPGFPTLQADSLSSELPGNPMGCGKHFVFSQKVNMGISYKPVILILAIYPKELKSWAQTATCTPVVTASLFTIMK